MPSRAMLSTLTLPPSPDILANPAYPTLSTPARLLLPEIEIALADDKLAIAFTHCDLREAIGFERAGCYVLRVTGHD